ncbi:hypothetical protein SAMN02745126_01458 [Enhydrobacter aerosaccus]|uniref:Ribonuclease VapC n=1 Tax=Enhydrobacter aerosaccus TaxID=225324 RepID=A0A1T4LB82_9HYPH|nr:type II toxin-antitoxin system VapC family toxin [Enhydrobacter aerosaccus]SJZ51863.1 hypothetical protein SAMN02745126_01458 [Enhydrobacter aerosaccus]
MYLLDTNVLAELRKVRAGKADAGVAQWADTVDTIDLYISVVTIEEIEIGVLRVERRDVRQGSMLRTWLGQHVLPAFADRVLPIDAAVALRSAQLHVPDPRSIRDCYIAATALVHGLTVVTRNIIDFNRTGVEVLNPWQGAL